MGYFLEPKGSITSRRTYALLKGALQTQLSALPFEQITLTDICNASLISRSTFYRYFEDKYDLLNYCLKLLLDEIGLSEDIIYFTDTRSMETVLTILIRHIEENRVMYQKIYNANKDGDLIRIIRRGLIQILTDKVQAAQQRGYQLKIPAPIFTSLIADFYFDIVTCYLEHADDYDTETFIKGIHMFVDRDFISAPDSPKSAPTSSKIAPDTQACEVN